MKKSLTGRGGMVLAAGTMLTLLVAFAARPDLEKTARDQAVDRLSRAMQFQTISFQQDESGATSGGSVAEFESLHEFLRTSFPLIHEKLELEKVGMSLLYHWRGTDPGADAILIMAHQDVVPIAPGTEADWTHPPFSGDIADGFVWGRGTMDCKGFVIAAMEAVESLLAEGYQPRRDIYLAFGHDEEIGGWNGAFKMSELLASRGVRALWVVDESGMIVDGRILGIQKPVAMIGIAEKGYMSLELTAHAAGGHSSMPGRESAIGILAEAVRKVEKNPFPARLDGVSHLTFQSLAPELPSVMRVAINNDWLFGPLIKSQLAKIPATDAFIRTTTAVTIINAGTKENVLPQEARAIVNFRLLPGDGADYVLERTRNLVNDPRITVEPVGISREASLISSVESEGWRILTSTINDKFPEAAISPYLCLGGTDARHYEPISDSIYRFVPMRVDDKDQERVHGTNERIGIDNYFEIIDFYRAMILNSTRGE